MNLGSAERARGQSVKPELDGVAAHKFLSQIGGVSFGCFSGRREWLLTSGLVINNPNTGAGELRIARSSLREDEIDSAINSKFISAAQPKQLGRFQSPFRRHSRPAFHFCQLAREKIGQSKSITPPGAPPIGHGPFAGRAKIDNRFSESARSASDPFAHLVARWKIDKAVFFVGSGDFG